MARIRRLVGVGTMGLALLACATDAAAMPSDSQQPGTAPAVGAARVVWVASGTAPTKPQAEAPPPLPEAPRRFSVNDVRFLAGLERASSIAGYHSTASAGGGREVVRHGVDASIVGNADQEPFTPLGLPRLGLDTRLPNDVSLGLTFSYAAHSETRDGQARPASESVLFGPRLGWLKPLSDRVGLWLRGGPTWALRASSGPSGEPGERLISTEQRWALSLEPQVLLMPLPHLGLTFGAAFDLAVTGENELVFRSAAGSRTNVHQESVSTFGVTAGLLALF